MERLIVNELRFHNFQILHKSIIKWFKREFLETWNIDYMYGVVFSIHLDPQLFTPRRLQFVLTFGDVMIIFSQPVTCNFVLTFEDVKIKPRIIVKETPKVNKC